MSFVAHILMVHHHWCRWQPICSWKPNCNIISKNQKLLVPLFSY